MVVCTKTGVKHLHVAAEAFDVGIYFEANGHGTVLFSERFLALLEDLDGPPTEPVRRVQAVVRVLNQAVGDALAGFLAVEAALRHQGWGLPEWLALYADLPSVMAKVQVQDRTQVRPCPRFRHARNAPGGGVAWD